MIEEEEEEEEGDLNKSCWIEQQTTTTATTWTGSCTSAHGVVFFIHALWGERKEGWRKTGVVVVVKREGGAVPLMHASSAEQ